MALSQQIQAAKDDIQQSQQIIEQVEGDDGPAIEITSYPTSLSKTVVGTEVHFQLKRGRIAYVPLDELFEEAKRKTRSTSNLRDLTDQINVAGPKRGFELRYVLMATPDRTKGTVSLHAEEFKVVPVQSVLGETADEALGASSQLRQDLARFNVKDTTITLWVYPDSFDEYRKINEELHKIGYSTAGRPLPEGIPIGGSPHGSKSSAQ